jgi:hypothetical protein
MRNLSIRAIALSALAVLAVWYAVLGGGAALREVIPDIAGYGPPPVLAGPISFAENPVGWLIALGSLVADIALVMSLLQIRRARRIAVRSEPLTPDDRMWAAHLAWLDECAVRVAHERGAKAS